MTQEVNNKPLTIKDIREVLIPAMQEVFATKKDLEDLITKREFETFKKTAMEVFTTKQDLEISIL